ncbi:lipopolysaccharide biosynthesis protein [Sphingobacterium sp.]|uniref:lipopolysaccharide biosynthesis protein n=1 Tax=Sphingobacterium sp. TaxID=341027 RepID=UPI0028A1EE47|nr:lipopolysaccharide biosynthesis protein [Sphingobacterium sp.]
MSLVKQAKQGMVWTFLQQFSVQLINFIVQIAMARILLPSDYGLIAMLTIFISVAQTLVDSGMTTSVIREKEINAIDYSTVFFTNLLISLTVYVIVFFIAPFVGVFYKQPILVDILRVYAISFVINAFVAVHLAKFTKELNFKKQFSYQVPSTIIGAISGFTFAYYGHGVWSLVYMNLVQTSVYALSLWIFSGWRPGFTFSKERFKHHFSFGYKLTLSGLLNTIYVNLYRIIIGKAFSPAQVGYFTQADNMRNLPVMQLSNVLNKVTYPLFAKIDDDVKLKKAYKTVMSLVLSLSALLMLGLLLVAKPLFLILLGEKWMPAVPFFQILCIASMMLPIGTYNLNILKVKGRSDLFLKVEIIKKVIGTICLFSAIPFGIEAIVWSLCITNIFFAYLNGFFSGKLINYLMLEQFKDSFRVIIVAIIPAIVIYFTLVKTNFFTNNWIAVLVIGLLYLVAYLLLIFIFNRDLVVQYKRILKR